MAHSSDACILLSDVVVNLFMVKSSKRRSNVILFAHLEVFSKVLVSTPPVSVNHTQTLVTSNLMDVRVANIILFTVSWVASVFGVQLVLAVCLADAVAPVLNHLLFLVLNHNEKQEGLVQVPHKADPHDSDAVLLVERIQLPVSVPNWIFVEAGDVLKSSPFLGVVTGLLSVENKFTKITIGLFREGSKQGISNLPVITCQSCQLFR